MPPVRMTIRVDIESQTGTAYGFIPPAAGLLYPMVPNADPYRADMARGGAQPRGLLRGVSAYRQGSGYTLTDLRLIIAQPVYGVRSGLFTAGAVQPSALSQSNHLFDSGVIAAPAASLVPFIAEHFPQQATGFNDFPALELIWNGSAGAGTDWCIITLDLEVE